MTDLPHQVAETIARAIEPHKGPKARRAALEWAMQVARGLYPAPASRTRPPARRSGITFEFTHEHQPYQATLNWDEAGQVIELFLDYGKDAASPLGRTARDAGIVLSLALQQGMTLADLRNAVSRDSEADQYGQPKNPADFGPAIGPAQSIIGAMIDAAVDVIEDIEGGRGNG